MKLEEVLGCLYDLQDAEVVRYKEKKFGVVSHNSLGYLPQRTHDVIAKEIGRDNDLALQGCLTAGFMRRDCCAAKYLIRRT